MPSPLHRRLGCAAGLAAVLVAPTAAGGQLRAPSSQVVFAFDGKGRGHGVGMAQDSANAMARSGLSHEQILNHFYPGTSRGSRQGPIRVMVWEIPDATGVVAVSVPSGAQVSDGQKSADAAPGAVLNISVDGGGYHVRVANPPPRAAAMRAAFVEVTPSPTPSPEPLPIPSTSPPPAPPSPSPSAGQSTASPQPSARPSASRKPTPAASPSPTAAPFAFDSASPVTLTPLGGGTAQVSPTGRRYRGQLLAIARQGFRLVNILDIEDYLRGLGEVPASWPPAALQTQAVAARTYAVRARQAGRPLGYDLCDDTSCQVYLGVQAESPRTAEAAAQTRGEVVTYRGAIADTFYSANAGGVTANAAEGFGAGTVIPYLRAGIVAVGDLARWNVTASPADVGARLGYPGRLDGVTVTQRGPSGRVLQLRLEGAAGAVQLSGVTAASRLGLWSTLFSVTRTSGTASALPAPDAAAGQLPPALAARQLPSPAPSPTPSASPSPAPGAAALRAVPRQYRYAQTVLLAALLVFASGLGVALTTRSQRQPATDPSLDSGAT